MLEYNNNKYEKEVLDTDTVSATGSRSSADKPDLPLAIFLDLERIAKSGEAVAMIDDLLEVVRPSLGSKPRMDGLKEAAGAIVAGLLEVAAAGPLQYAYRPMNPAEFTAKAISHRRFKRVLDALRAGGYVDYIPGECPARPTKEEPRLAARVRPEPALIEVATRHGIKPAAWQDHFCYRPRNAAAPHPILLRSSSRKKLVGRFKREKVDGKPMQVDAICPKVLVLANEVHELNAFLCKQDIQPEQYYRGLFRLFHDGDLCTPYQWNKGGRLYDLGRGKGYQSIEKEKRKHLTINGQPVAEVDLKGSHLRILYAREGILLDPADDPYAVPGIPRAVVKYWVTMTLGYTKHHSRWTNDTKQDYQEDDDTKGRHLQKDYPFSKTQAAILEHIPLLRPWASSTHRWGDLQYIESCILVDAMKALCLGQGIPALPLHDSLIIPVPYIDAAKRALSEAFYKHTGARPGISVK
jgi:hypothetical protein